MVPWFACSAAIMFVAGLYISFFVAPTDIQQGEAYRIMFIHVPASIPVSYTHLTLPTSDLV